jgi:DNA-binding transcriptional LysR family regulator
MDLNAARVFVAVAEHRSFSKAARRLDLPTSTVSRRITALEAELGVTLLERTTRQVRLTGAGRLLLDRCIGHLAGLGQAEEALQEFCSEPRGRLRVAFPTGLSRYAASDITLEYLERFPQVRLELVMTDERVVPDGQDLHIALRAGQSDALDASLIQRSLGAIPMVIGASPTYLAAHPAIAHPRDLLGHGCIVLGHSPDAANITLKRDDDSDTQNLRVPIRLFTTSVSMCRRVALAGHGVAGLPEISCREAVTSGTFVPVLPGWRLLDSPLTVYYPNQNTTPLRVRAFLDLLIARLNHRSPR